MQNNTPTLMQSEEKEAPWNQKTKTLSLYVSQCLSASVTIEVPEDFDEDDRNLLYDYVREQVTLPDETINEQSPVTWYIDDLCITT